MCSRNYFYHGSRCQKTEVKSVGRRSLLGEGLVQACALGRGQPSLSLHFLSVSLSRFKLCLSFFIRLFICILEYSFLMLCIGCFNLHVCMCTMCAVSQKDPLELVTGSCEPVCGCWRLNPGALEGRPVLSAALICTSLALKYINTLCYFN